MSIDLLFRDLSRDDCRIPLLRGTSRDRCMNSLPIDVNRDTSRCSIIETPV